MFLSAIEGIDAPRALDRAGLGGSVASVSGGVAAGGAFANPDGRSVDAPDGTLFLELGLAPAEGSLVRVEVALPPRARWNGRLVGLGNGGAGGFLPYREQGAYLRLKGRVLLGCADGVLEPLRVKPDGKREMDVVAWAAGLQQKSGAWGVA